MSRLPLPRSQEQQQAIEQLQEKLAMSEKLFEALLNGAAAGQQAIVAQKDAEIAEKQAMIDSLSDLYRQLLREKAALQREVEVLRTTQEAATTREAIPSAVSPQVHGNNSSATSFFVSYEDYEEPIKAGATVIPSDQLSSMTLTERSSLPTGSQW